MHQTLPGLTRTLAIMSAQGRQLSSFGPFEKAQRWQRSASFAIVRAVATRDPDLRPLINAIERAAQAQREAAHREVISVLPMAALLDQSGERLVWRLVGTIRDREPEIYNAFVGEPNLYNLIVTAAVKTIYEGHLPHIVPGPRANISWSQLLATLREHSQQRWLVGVPIANVAAPSEYVELGASAGLAATVQADDDKGIHARSHRWAMEQHLGARLFAGVRRQADNDGSGWDSRRTAMLAFAEDGSCALCLERATSRARYTLALWCLLKPPSEQGALWPTICEWEPQPYQINHIHFKQLDVPSASEQGNSIIVYDLYELPSDEGSRSAPFAAMDAAMDPSGPGALHARAVLSAAWVLYSIERTASDLQRTDQLMQLGTAMAALCDIEEGRQPGSLDRWKYVTDLLGIWRNLKGAYTQRELENARRLSSELRNISVHSSDTVLLNLDFPTTLTRELSARVRRTGEELALARMAATQPILRHAIREVALHFAQHGIQHGWDDTWFKSQLVP
jgi:hypothetical protein